MGEPDSHLAAFFTISQKDALGNRGLKLVILSGDSIVFICFTWIRINNITPKYWKLQVFITQCLARVEIEPTTFSV